MIRVEIPPTRSRWESVYVAESIPLARGWLRQMESPDFDLFTDGNLTAAAYAKWLRAHGVDYVAVPDADRSTLKRPETAADEIVAKMLAVLPAAATRAAAFA